MTVNPIPEGFRTVTPYLVVDDVNALVEFLQKAFDAKIKDSVSGPDGVIKHTEVQIGDSMVMMGKSNEQWRPLTTAIYLYVPDTDAVYKQAMDAGATSVMEPADQFYGDRNGGVQDPAGNYWWIGTRKEDLSAEEIQKRAEQQGAV